MHKNAPSKVTAVKPPLRTAQDERTRAHRTVNWVVSVILIAFAIWSIQLNAQGRGMLKQSTAVVEGLDTKIDTLSGEMKAVEAACKQTTVVIPTTTTDTTITQ